MAKYRNGLLKISSEDFIYCPICGVQEKGGKKFRVKCSLISVDILPHTAPFLSAPIPIDVDDAIIQVRTERERVGWDGPGLRVIFLCEDGHKWERVIANHGEEAICFAQILDDQVEKEIEMDRLAMSDRPDDPDNEDDDDDEDEEEGEAS